jgi:hypothetical protein
VEQAEPHPVADGELHRAVMNIIVLAGVFLGLEKTAAHLVEEGVPISKEGVDGVGTSAALLIRQQYRRRAAVDDSERRGPERGME